MIHEPKKNSTHSKLTIQDWAIQERPREKYLSSGFSALSDTELIAILIRNGTKSQSAVDVARKLLATCNFNLNFLSEIKFDNLLNINGIGKVKAITLLAVFELGKRCKSQAVEKKRRIESTKDLVDLMQTKNACQCVEEFWVVYVNQGAFLLGAERFGRGGLTNTSVDIRLIMGKALELKATGIFLCHNHPSGDITPSKHDFALTKKIENAAALLTIKVLDHIVISREDYYSFAEKDILISAQRH
jgi:DNA repair protein RadC